MSYPQDTIRRRVRRGVKLLDEYGPKNWRKRINVETLDVGSSKLCVLGQVYGDYYEGKKKLGRKIEGRRNGYLDWNTCNASAFTVSQEGLRIDEIEDHRFARLVNETWRRELQSV